MHPLVTPVFLRPSVAADRSALPRLIEDRRIEVYDTIEAQLCELVQTRTPTRKLSPEEARAGAAEIVGPQPLSEYGVWVHYPWSRRLVHLLDAEEFIELRTSRNRYLITAEEQAELVTKRIGIVGLSVGQSVALAIALERGAGELRLADFDTLELSNLNRLRGGVHQLGLPKVAIIAQAIAEQDPYLHVRPFFDGLTTENEDRFFTEGGQLDLVIDECDGLDMKVRLREKARELGIPVVMQTTDRGMLDIERFDLEPSRPFFHGLAGDLRAANLVGLTNEEKVAPLLKMIGATTLSTRATASLLEVERSIRTWPQLGSAVTLGGGLAADAARRVLLGQLRGSGRFYVDLGELVADPSLGPSPFGRGRALDGASARLLVQGPNTSVGPGWMEDGIQDKGSPSPEGGGARGGVRPEVVRHLVSRAILAPSGGNHQPWQWTARGTHLNLREDPARRMGLGDYDNLGTAVALGAAAESLVLAAHAEGLEVRTELRDEPDFLAIAFDLGASEPNEGHDFDALATQIEHRHTDRRPGDRSVLPAAQWEALQVAARSVPGVALTLLTERPEIEALAELIGQGDRLRMLDPTLSREMFAELRWTREEAERTGDGLEVDSLALSATDRAGLELCLSPEALALLAKWDLGSGLARLGRNWASSSSAFGLLTTQPSDRRAFVQGGRALQRLWLAATREGLALHPLTFLPFAFARMLRGGGRGFAPGTVQGLADLRAPYAQLLGLDGTGGEVLLFRLFLAEDAVRASARRSVEAVLRVE